LRLHIYYTIVLEKHKQLGDTEFEYELAQGEDNQEVPQQEENRKRNKNRTRHVGTSLYLYIPARA
jgi:hypothetical protein